jgi:hypothetical protein
MFWSRFYVSRITIQNMNEFDAVEYKVVNKIGQLN